MPKLRGSNSKADIYEVTIKDTRCGKCISQVSVNDSESVLLQSQTASPSKKRAWSPGMLADNNGDIAVPDQVPKRSQTFGKVLWTFLWIKLTQTIPDRLKMNSLKSMLVNNIAFLSNFSNMNQLHWWPHVWVANNLRAHIGVMIALGQTFGVMIVVSPVTKTILSIGFRCGMGSFSRNPIFSRGDLQYISPIIPTVALPFHSMLKLIIHLTLIYWMRWMILSIYLSPHIHRNLEQTSNPNQN